MPVNNSEIASQLEEIADLLEIEGANVFRVRAYRSAARTVADLPIHVADLVARQEPFPKTAGIGNDLAVKILQIARSGGLPLLDKLRRKTAPGVVALLRVPGLGPKRVRVLRDRLHINGIADLRKAAESGRIRKLRGFSEKTEHRILEETQKPADEPRRLLLSEGEHLVEAYLAYLRAFPGVPGAPGVKDLAVAGSYRRQVETLGDIDILVACPTENIPKLIQHFIHYDRVTTVVARGETRVAVRLLSGINVDLRVLPPAAFGAALHYFTGSKAHNIAIRMLGVRRGLKINEYGVFRGNRRIGGRTEEEVFAAVDLPYIEPELREARGELEAAAKNALPQLVVVTDLRGDLHAHTDETDGRATLEEMTEAAQAKGYEYLAITDHSRHLSVARGVDPRRLRLQLRKIDRLNARLRGFRILKGIELDILDSGALDLPNEVLAELDLRVCSIHYKFNLSREQQTERILRAMDNRYFNILAHPTGRLLGKRPPYEIDIPRILSAARERGCSVELNSQPDRLDLDDTHCLAAKRAEVPVAISTDAHSVSELDFTRFGISQARRGWLEPHDVLNTRPLAELLKFLRR